MSLASACQAVAIRAARRNGSTHVRSGAGRLINADSWHVVVSVMQCPALQLTHTQQGSRLHTVHACEAEAGAGWHSIAAAVDEKNTQSAARRCTEVQGAQPIQGAVQGAQPRPASKCAPAQVQLGKGVTVSIKFKAQSDLLPNGTKEVFFEINGVPRVIQVVDRTQARTPGSGDYSFIRTS